MVFGNIYLKSKGDLIMTAVDFAPFAIAGFLLSILLEYVPGFAPWFNALEDNYQRLVTFVALLVVVAGAFALSCVGWEQIYTCDDLGAKDALYAFVAALVANQATHPLLPRKSQ
jgi:hypothetical protein